MALRALLRAVPVLIESPRGAEPGCAMARHGGIADKVLVGEARTRDGGHLAKKPFCVPLLPWLPM